MCCLSCFWGIFLLVCAVTFELGFLDLTSSCCLQRMAVHYTPYASLWPFQTKQKTEEVREDRQKVERGEHKKI